MSNTNSPTIANLKRAIEIAETIEKLQAQLVALVGREVAVAKAPVAPAAAAAPTTEKPTKARRAKRQLSAEGRARIIAAQRARWAKIKGEGKTAAPSKSAEMKPAKAAKSATAVQSAKKSAPKAKAKKK